MGCIKSKAKVIINYDKRNSEALTASTDNQQNENKLHSIVLNSIKSYSSNPIIEIINVNESDGMSFQKELKERMNSLILQQNKEVKTSTMSIC